MEINKWLNKDVPSVAQNLENLNKQHFFGNKTIGFAGKETVKKIIYNFRAAIFPGVYETHPIKESRVNILIGNYIRIAALDLCELTEQALMNDACKEEERKEGCTKCRDKANRIVRKLVNNLPNLREILNTDIDAAYNGDPAAKSREEILLGYPSIEAISVYRIAHLLYEEHVPLIPRIMTEYAHQVTGIDIHPGAKIGKSFFIDHGTGIVIGETCTIGEKVKIYQGVTLGAKSFPLDKNGNPIKGVKRHPDIGDNVVIYAGATILGGNTIIGENSVIGGNVWLTHSVQPYSNVINSQPSPEVIGRNGNG